MNPTRRILKSVLPLAGMLVAFLGVLYVEGDILQLLTVLGGILLVEAGVWYVANPLQTRRRYHELRTEVNSFLERVRRLNTAAVQARASDDAQDWENYRAIVDELHESIGGLARVAGKEEGMRDIPAQRHERT